MKSNIRKKPRVGASAANQAARAQRQAPQAADEGQRLIARDEMEQLRVDSLNKLRTKGARNRNNPVNEIQKATEVVIVKQANYINCVTCNLCVTDNVYKVYLSDTEHLLPKDAAEAWPSSTPNFADASPAKRWQILPSKIEDHMDEVEMLDVANPRTEEVALGDYATKYSTNEKVKPGPAPGVPGAEGGQTQQAGDDDDLLPPPNILRPGAKQNLQYEGGRRDGQIPAQTNYSTASRNQFGGRRVAAEGESAKTHSQQPTNKAPFLRKSNYYFDYAGMNDNGYQEPTSDEILPAPDFNGQMAPEPGLGDATESQLQATDGDEPYDADNVDLAGMAHEVDLEQMDLDGVEKPITEADIDKRLQELLKTKTKIKKSLQERNPRILKIEQESILLQKLFCPGSCRPYEAYALSSNGTFEFARLEREFQCTFLAWQRPQINVYKSEYKYQDINDHFTEEFLGKIVQRMSVFGRSLDVYESSSSELKPIYKIQGRCGSSLKEFFCPRLPFGPCRGTTYKIIDQRGPPARDDDLEPGATSVDNFDTGIVSTEWSHCTKELCSRGTHYRLRFPRRATVHQKVLLVSAVMMLDMSFNEGGCLFC